MAKKNNHRVIKRYQRKSVKTKLNKRSTHKTVKIAVENAPNNQHTHLKSTWLLFIKFGGLSGLGWLGDFGILLFLVSVMAISADKANFISASIAATTVFLVSRETLFSKAAGRGMLRTAMYFIYTLGVIAIASVAIRIVIREINYLAISYDINVSYSFMAATAKILVTPPTLIINFLVSRVLSESQFKRA